MGNNISRRTHSVSITRPSDIVCSSDSSCVIDKSDSVERTQKFSCWDKLDPAWLNDAKCWYKIYVHEEILEWIVKLIHESILNENLRANVEEVHHHNLDGRVYLIQFYYLCETNENDWMRTIGAERDILTSIQKLLTYKMPWKIKPTYFLRQDSKFKNQNARIMKKLRKNNLHKSFRATSSDVNWLYISKVKIYEFFTVLSVEQVKTIDSIFCQELNSCAAFYICDQFLWHREVYSYIELDKLAMDICVEQWKRYDLLKDFAINEILQLDLANKDYRDPDFNKYLDRYLNTLLKKRLPQLFSEPNKNLVLPINRLQPYLQHYFVSRFHDKITNFCCWSRPESLFVYDIATISNCRDQTVLQGNRPLLKNLSKVEFHCRFITYNISNYIHFSNSIFQAFLNKPNDHQTYNIRFDKEFHFLYEYEQETIIQVTHDCKWTSDNKTVKIYLENCTQNNAEKLMNFVKYLINLFNERRKLASAEISLCLIDCMLDDYTFLQNIGHAFDHVEFKRMNISSQQIKILSCALTQQSSITFFDCAYITDNDLMTLLENIDFNRIWIEGSNACTPAIYFLMAEHLMNKEGVTTIGATRFLKNMYYSKYNFYFNFKDIEFYKGDNQIVAQNCYTKEIVDIYCLMYDIEETFSLYQDFRFNSEKN